MYDTITKAVIIASVAFFSQTGLSQVGIATTTPNADALLEVNSTPANPGGVLLPRMALTMTTSPAPLSADVAGMIVYNTATAGDVTPGFYYNDGTDWIRIGAGATSADWTITGNAGTVAGTNFIGTTDAVDFVTRTNNTERMRVLSDGRVSVNNATPFTTGNLVSHSTTANHAIAVQSTSTGAGLYSEKTGLGYGIHHVAMNAAALGVFSDLNNNTGSDDAIIGHGNNNAGFGGGWFLNNNGSNGTGYGSAEQGYGVLGMNTVTSDYSVGVMGTVQGVGNNGKRSSAVFGSNSSGTTQNSAGALGYRVSGGGNTTFYGGYFFTSGSTTGTGTGRLSAPSAAANVGIGAIGGLMGGWAKGSVYGFTTKGDRYSLYVQGREFTNDIITQLHDNGNNQRVATYVPTSTSVDVTAKGVANLASGNATITFDKNFSNMVSSKEPIIITVTPIGESNGIHLVKTSENGFTVKENNNGNSNVQFTWIAVATKKGYENVSNPSELLTNDYDTKLNDFMIDENDPNAKGQIMWWDGDKIRYSGAPKSLNGITVKNKESK